MPQPALRLPRRRTVGLALAACGAALVPWLACLATGLPATYPAVRWPLAWAGLDALEAAGLLTTGLLTARHDPRHRPAAAATAALLVADAWFDTVTAVPGADFASALAMAVALELPLATVCAALAARAPGDTRPSGPAGDAVRRPARRTQEAPPPHGGGTGASGTSERPQQPIRRPAR
ncbi:hypothetical protein [Streptomyces caatingaensis]|uniref:hypothetical protein n=1 Tax=Streptomyces caatingaensis TaxID=1678637 RepID=UPI000A5A3029|nr:hypothetical protein [Streptomyces caatingaensis]